MKNEFPAAVPEIPVSDLDPALDYYQNILGFAVDWGRSRWRHRGNIERTVQDVPHGS